MLQGEKEINMKKIYKPIQIEIDNEESDDGFLSLGFIFNYDTHVVPHYISICRDFIENPDFLYLETDDQIYGFYTKNIKYHIEGFILKVTLEDKNKFYWSDSKSILIELNKNKITEVISCLESMFNGLQLIKT